MQSHQVAEINRCGRITQVRRGLFCGAWRWCHRPGPPLVGNTDQPRICSGAWIAKWRALQNKSASSYIVEILL